MCEMHTVFKGDCTTINSQIDLYNFIIIISEAVLNKHIQIEKELTDDCEKSKIYNEDKRLTRRKVANTRCGRTLKVAIAQCKNWHAMFVSWKENSFAIINILFQAFFQFYPIH